MSRIPKMSPVRHHKIKNVKHDLRWEIRKTKPSTFDIEKKKGEEAKAWFLGMMKYLQLYNYSSNMKDWISI